MYNKLRKFKYHFIRNSLLNVWLIYKKYLPNQRPLWIIPEEVIHSIIGSKGKTPLSYQNLLIFKDEQVSLKSEVELDQKYDWWTYLQIKDLTVTKNIMDSGIN